MDIKAIQKQFTESDKYVLSEAKKLQFFYGLKREIRYGEARTDLNDPESVAEHVYGMHILANYFLPLENPEKTWDTGKIMRMISFHDVDEVVTGDKIGYLKTKADIEEEVSALKAVYDNAPEVMLELLKADLKEYHERISSEAKFVKAIDKIEPIVHLYNEAGKELLKRMGTTFEQNAQIKVKYFEGFTYITRFYQVVAYKMKNDGYFVDPA